MDKRTSIEIESPGVNVAAVRREAGGWKFLLVRRADTETYPGLWGFVTGGREGKETIPELAVRELAEETGLTPERLWASEYCMQFYEPTVDRIWILPIIVAVVSSSVSVNLCHENSDYRWVSAGEGVKLVVWQNLKRALGDLGKELDAYPAPNWVELPLKD